MNKSTISLYHIFQFLTAQVVVMLLFPGYSSGMAVVVPQESALFFNFTGLSGVPDPFCLPSGLLTKMG